MVLTNCCFFGNLIFYRDNITPPIGCYSICQDRYNYGNWLFLVGIRLNSLCYRFSDYPHTVKTYRVICEFIDK